MMRKLIVKTTCGDTMEIEVDTDQDIESVEIAKRVTLPGLYERMKPLFEILRPHCGVNCTGCGFTHKIRVPFEECTKVKMRKLLQTTDGYRYYLQEGGLPFAS